MVGQGIKKLMEEKQLTARQLAEISGVPISTVTRVISSQTSDPGILTVTALVSACDGSLDALMGLTPPATAPNADHSALVDMYERTLATKNKWIQRLFVVCCCLLVFVLAYLVMDATNGNFGLIRY